MTMMTVTVVSNNDNDNNNDTKDISCVVQTTASSMITAKTLLVIAVKYVTVPYNY